MIRKILPINKMVKEMESKGVHFPETIQRINEEELFEEGSSFYLPNLRDTAILACGYDLYQKIRDLHNKNLIHIGLRNFNYNLVKSIPIVTLSISGLRFVFTDGMISGQPDWSKIDYFIKENLEKEVPKLEQFDIIHLDKIHDCLMKLEYLNPRGEFLGFDFESRDFPLTSNFKPLGFSIVGSKYGFYVDFRDHTDYRAPEFSEIRKFIESNYKRLVVFNCNFEIRAVEHMWQEMLLFPDAWALAVCDDERSNLKALAQMYLGVPDWDAELADEELFFNKLMHGGQYGTEVWEPCPNQEVFFERLKQPEWKKYRTRLSEVMNACIERRVIGENIPDDKIPEFSQKIKQGYKDRLLNAWGNEWELCDPWTLGKYCCYDSYYTKLIWDKLHGVYPRAEEPISNNFYYGSFIESTGIPINTKKLHILQDYLHKVQVNTGIFYLKFYKYCLEDTVGDYVDSLQLNEYAQNLISDYPWMLSFKPEKVLKELLKACSDETGTSVNWKKLLNYMSKDLGMKVWELVKDDEDPKLGYFTVACACRRHKNDWIRLGEEFEELTEYQGFIERVNDRNLELSKPVMAKFNQDVIKFEYPFRPVNCKTVAWYFENKVEHNGARGIFPWKVKVDHPETSNCYDFVKEQWEQYDKDFRHDNYLEGRKFKLIKSFIDKDDLEKWRHVFNFHASVPSLVMRELPLEVTSVEEVANLLQLRRMEPFLAKWDNVKVDGDLPEGVDYDYAKWVALEMVQWSSWQKTLAVSVTMLKKYGWLCSAITQFWNFWWEPGNDHKQDDYILDYAIKTAQEDKENWIEDVKEYMYQASINNGGKAERAVAVDNFSIRFGFEGEPIRKWRMFNINKDTTMNIERRDNKLFEDWDNAYKFFIYWDLGQGCDKQLNPYIEGDKGMVPNSKKLDRVLGDGSEVINMDEPGDRFMTRFKICGVTTKRTSGFFHTFSPHSDEYIPVEAEEGKLITYFDVSQAEPRVAAFVPKDPNFMGDYLAGKDVYLALARQYKPGLSDDELKRKYRAKCKQLILG